MQTIRKNIFWIFYIWALVAALPSCTDRIEEESEPPVDESYNICIGGMETDALTISADEPAQTRASEDEKKDAETVDWLLDPLFEGLDITYRISGSDAKKVAILKLEKADQAGGNTFANIKKSSGGLAEYSFKYRVQDQTAQWFGNGYHYFEGVCVPNQIRYDESSNSSTILNRTLEDIAKEDGTAPGLYYDQSKDQSEMATGKYANYTLLERYLAMPANWGHNATIERIKLPFKHRLARVIAYVLIDPVLDGVKIDGYTYQKDGEGNVTKEDATSSAIRFSNVKVLSGVKQEIDDTGHATLTPQWTAARKAIPHFLDERGSVNAKGEVQDAEHFIMFYNTAEKQYIFPANDYSEGTKTPWTTAKNAWQAKYNQKGGTEAERIKYADENSGYVRTVYGKAPVYDIIVRPTYSSTNTVMYDEVGDKTQLANETNVIYFEITLDNGLHYEKKFEFDLDANFQTIVYLRIKPESVDYNSSGAEVWIEDGGEDGYYGVNNQNGNTLSFAGNSWQRAYRIGTKHNNVTDGHFYDNDTEDEYAQYVDDATWIKMFSEATEDGAHHGDYFILEQDLTISAKSLPDDFVFTGHLDGQGHTITLTDPGASWEQWFDATEDDYDHVETTLYTSQDKSSAFIMPTVFTKEFHDVVYYQEGDNDVKYQPAVLYTLDEYNALHALTEEQYQNLDDAKKIKTPATKYTAEEAAAYNEAHKDDDDFIEVLEGYIKTPAVYYEDADEYNAANPFISETDFKDLLDADKTKAAYYYIDGTDTRVIPGVTVRTADHYEYPSANPSRKELLTAEDGTYYTRSGDAEPYNYSPYNKPQHLYTEVDRHSGSSLFGGLNAKYTTRQENGQSPWEANIHKENNKWVPVAGYRAELLNVKLATDCKFFPDGAVFTGNDLNKVGATVTGYIFNCWEGSAKIENIVPIPQY